ncbi:MAG: hypothetical protein D6718_00205 [Acidobacteria bacterium]|nr:MAG: hypothetical protein D6718_00205 [Acidobacteriota bacterium]
MSPKKRAIYSAVLAVLLVALAYQYRGLLVPRGGEELADPLAGLDEKLRAMAELPRIEVEKAAAGWRYVKARNPFEYGEDPAMAELRRRRERERKRQQAELERKRQEAEQARREAQAKAPPPPPPAPRPPDFGYEYIGRVTVLGNPQRYVAILNKKGAGSGKRIDKENLRHVVAGEIIDDQFVIEKIDLDSIVIGFTDPRFSGQTKTLQLVPSRSKG